MSEEVKVETGVASYTDKYWNWVGNYLYDKGHTDTPHLKSFSIEVSVDDFIVITDWEEAQ